MIGFTVTTEVEKCAACGTDVQPITIAAPHNFRLCDPDMVDLMLAGEYSASQGLQFDVNAWLVSQRAMHGYQAGIDEPSVGEG